MGVTGAGKTSLLDVLADRVTIGVVSGEMLIDGRLRDDSFQRKTGYVQQQDLHLETSTVREALVFSALLRQPATISRQEKVAYVEEVIHMLGMEEYANAVVGVVGEGLNVEQRKRLTIGVELAAKPDLLLFFDEPTSGLDSQTAWSICTLMRNLADHGQAVLCTIHQPSAMLMQQFDRLLFLAKGGRTVYFGNLGPNMETLIKYFEDKGSPKCPPNANPAEWMLEVIGAAPGSYADRDWAEQWTNSAERAEAHRELAEMKKELSKKPVPVRAAGYGEFAMPIWYQFLVCSQRMFQQYWRSPSYLYAKVLSCTASPLFLGFTFWRMSTSLQGMQNQMFAIFMLLVLFPGLVQQMMPSFVTQRALYEVRERPSKAYSWKAFMLASILVELVWNILMSVPAFFCWYYPIGFYHNAERTNTVVKRSGIMYLLILQFMMFTSTFSSMVIAGIEEPGAGSNIAQFMFSLCLVFNGVLANSSDMPRFWIFMNHVSPFTYFVSSVLSTGLSGTTVECSSIEWLTVSPPDGQTCSSYLDPYIKAMHGTLLNPEATVNCKICPMSSTDQFLASLNMSYSDVPRNIGLMFAYVGFNIVAALVLYWLFRVPKHWSRKGYFWRSEQPQFYNSSTQFTGTPGGIPVALSAPCFSGHAVRTSATLTMGVFSLIIINKAGGLIYQREFQSGLRNLSTNDYLVLAGTFHGVHAITRSITPKIPISQPAPSPATSSTGITAPAASGYSYPNPGVPVSGLDYLETDKFRMTCFQTLTGTKFLLFTDPLTGSVDTIIQKIYELYADYVMKNPFYQIEMPVRCEAFDRHLGAWLRGRA
ncbi:hypothetical protein PENFLA_c046G06969 [Penicillium flavigenum]|uniref:Trafficking protein particle complex subunit n=1 Tax=Penicillium flavigenum TaxID=254877 RepID=A0A1V6SHP7_9EURO|nr:hypothetical protein PENFLA_c046G06969 [Penicillium flavigenum]